MKTNNKLQFIGKFDSVKEALLHPNGRTSGSVIIINNHIYVLDSNNTWHLLDHLDSEHNELLSTISYYKNKAIYGTEFTDQAPEPDPVNVSRWLSEYEQSVSWANKTEEMIVCQDI